MGFTMSLNFILLLVMVATNILSLYHLSSTVQSPKPPLPAPVPEHLIRQLNTIRSTINHLTRHNPSSASATAKPSSVLSLDLILHSQIGPIASSCYNHPDLLHRFMNYTPFSTCPFDSDIQETLILNGCHPLPRRRCFSKTPSKPPSSLPLTPFPTSLPDSGVIWNKYSCKSFACLSFDLNAQRSSLLKYTSELDLPISQFMQLATSANSAIRLGIDIGSGTGTFAAVMKKSYNVTVLTTTMNVNAPYCINPFNPCQTIPRPYPSQVLLTAPHTLHPYPYPTGLPHHSPHPSIPLNPAISLSSMSSYCFNT